MLEFKKGVLLLLAASLFAIPSAFGITDGISEACKRVYAEGGLRAVLQSPECSRWTTFELPLKNRTRNCQYSFVHGRDGMKDDDRLACNLDLQIPFPGKNGHEEVRVGVVAVFDGYNGHEVSGLASKLIVDYFILHSMFIADEERSKFKEERVMLAKEHSKGEKPEQDSILVSSNGSTSVVSDESRHMGILKEALLRTIRDIEIAFSEEAVTSASTATVVVLAHNHTLVASVGLPKAVICSEIDQSLEDRTSHLRSYIFPRELTRDLPISKEDERARLLAHLLPPDGFMYSWRDRHLTNIKSHGFIAEHEVSEWNPLTASYMYLVVATGLFQRVTPQTVCDALPMSKHQYCSFLKKESDCIYYVAFMLGNTDNLSVVVVPLRSAGFTPENMS